MVASRRLHVMYCRERTLYCMTYVHVCFIENLFGTYMINVNLDKKFWHSMSSSQISSIGRRPILYRHDGDVLL